MSFRMAARDVSMAAAHRLEERDLITIVKQGRALHSRAYLSLTRSKHSCWNLGAVGCSFSHIVLWSEESREE